MEDLVQTLPRIDYPLSPLDVVPSHLYISNCLFFENKGNDRSFALEHVLETGLYHALRKFPILVGELRPNGLNTMHIAVNPDKPNFPTWEMSNSATSFQDLKLHGFHASHWPEELVITDPLVHGDVSSTPKLLRTRLCRFADNRGVAVVIRIAHAVVDAKGAVAFINYWAYCCRELLSRPSAEQDNVPDPILDREAMYLQLPADSQPASLHWLLYPLSCILAMLLKLLAFFMKKQLTFGDSESHLFAVPRQKLDLVQSTAKDSGMRISDNDVVVALFTMAYAQTRKASKASKSVKAIIPCDFRHRLGIPENYTGNCAVGLFMTAPSEHLMKPITAESIARVAVACRQAVDSADNATIKYLVHRAMQSIRLLGNQARILYSLMVCQAFSNQSRLEFYSADFGFGPPCLAVPVAYPRTLAVIVPSPPPGDEVYVWLALQTLEMGRLRGNEGFQSFVRVIY
ncbi:hypothetical protein DL767_002690 [Monosporascus sp. MG133]|nr:hypothetical protein DL767_002690 [Monosporascus sp. MG133]